MKDEWYQTNYEPDSKCWNKNCKQVKDESTMFMIENCGIKIDANRVAVTFMLVTASHDANDNQVWQLLLQVIK